MAASVGGRENGPPGEESVFIEMVSQHNKDPERDKHFSVKNKGPLEKERQFQICYRKLDDYKEYALSKKYIGTAIIINNLDREQPATREDVHVLSELLKKTGFQTHVYLNCTKPEMNDVRTDVILNESTHENSSSFVLIVIALSSQIETEQHIMDINGRNVWKVKKLERQLNSIEALKGKPKLIIVEACRGHRCMRISKKSYDPNRTADPMPLRINNKDETDDSKFIQNNNHKGVNGTQQQSHSSSACTFSSNPVDMKDRSVTQMEIQSLEPGLNDKGETNDGTLIHKGVIRTQQGSYSSSAHTYSSKPVDMKNRAVTQMEIQGSEAGLNNKYGKDERNLILEKNTKQMDRTQEESYSSSASTYSSKPADKVDRVVTKMQMQSSESRKNNKDIMENGNFIQKNNNKEKNRTQQGSYSTSVSTNCSKDVRMKDQMICFATVEGSAALTLKKFGSAYLQMLAKKWKELMYLEMFTDIHIQVTSELANKPLIAQREEYQVPQSVSTFDKQFNFANYLFGKKREFGIPMRGHAYFKSMTKDSIIGQGYSILRNRVKHYNVFERYYYIPEYEVPEGEQNTEYFIPKGAQVLRESTEQSYLEYMPNPSIKDGMATITFHKEFRTACVSFSKLRIFHEDSQFSYFFKNKLKSDVENEKPKELTEKNLEDFFDFFDNNFIVSHYMGGSVTVTILVNAKSKMLNDGNKEKEIVKDHMDKIFSRTVINDEKLHKDLNVVNVEFEGGIIEDVPENFENIEQYHISTWIESIITNPIPLTTEMTLAPIHLAVAEVDSGKGELILKEGMKRRKDEERKIGREENEGRGTFFSYTKKILKQKNDTILPENTEFFRSKLVKYIGDAENSQMHGDGKGYFRNGDIYSGQWREGKPEGLGTWYYKSENQIFHLRGIFKNGKMEITNTLSGRPKKRFYERTSFWLKSFVFFIAAMIMGVVIGWALWPPPPTCTEKISEQWKNIYYRTEQDHTRTYMEFKMSFLNKSTQRFCNGTTVYIDNLPFPSDLDCSAIAIPDDDSVSHVFEFNFPKKLTTDKILHPHGDKQFRIRSCKPGTNCKKSLANSKAFMCVHNKRTKFRNLTCPETIVYNWGNIAEYNKSSSTLTVDLTTIIDRCQLGKKSVYMEVVEVHTEHTWEDCQDITTKDTKKAFPQIFKFNKITEVQEVKLISGHFIIRFKQGGGSCRRDERLSHNSDCESYDCTPMLTYQDLKEHDIFKVGKNTGNSTSKINPKF